METGRTASRGQLDDKGMKVQTMPNTLLIPVELEKINMFPEHHTKGAPDVKRAFLMGNALVVGVVEKLGRSLAKLA